MNKNLIVVGVIALVLGFLGGAKYGQNVFSNKAGNFPSQMMRNGGMRGDGMTRGQQGGFISGEVLTLDDKSMTVKMRDGGSKIVFLSSSTEIGKSVVGKMSDLMMGNQVMVSGEANSDGSVNAKTIQIRELVK